MHYKNCGQKMIYSGLCNECPILLIADYSILSIYLFLIQTPVIYRNQQRHGVRMLKECKGPWCTTKRIMWGSRLKYCKNTSQGLVYCKKTILARIMQFWRSCMRFRDKLYQDKVVTCATRNKLVFKINKV